MIYYRGAPCADSIFLEITDIFPLKEGSPDLLGVVKTLRRRNFTIFTIVVAFLVQNRGQKINANFFWTKFFENPSGHGRPRRKLRTSAPKSAFSCGPGDGEKLFDPRASGRKGQERPQEIQTKKFMFMLFFPP